MTAQWGSHQRQCVTEQSNKGGVKLKFDKLACNVQCLEEMLLVGYLHQQISITTVTKYVYIVIYKAGL